MPEPVPWWATATSIAPPNIDPEQWEAMTSGERFAAWTEYRSTNPTQEDTPND